MTNLYWLSDEAWAAIEPELPRNQPGARRVDDRRVIPGRINRKRPIRYDERRNRDRWRIEATICRFKDFRRVATRYDQLVTNFLTAVTLAAIVAYWT